MILNSNVASCFGLMLTIGFWDKAGCAYKVANFYMIKKFPEQVAGTIKQMCNMKKMKKKALSSGWTLTSNGRREIECWHTFYSWSWSFFGIHTPNSDNFLSKRNWRLGTIFTENSLSGSFCLYLKWDLSPVDESVFC